MNKKYIAGGLIFWAGLSGYMGLRILESYTEDAVYAALSAVPAQAEVIRYSFLSNTLSLKNVEYELPHEHIMHKGTIESVEVTGFNRKCMFVKPNMPAYDADTLPIVAESITASGIVDSIHVDNTRVEQKIADVQIKGWYQRLGLLLDQRSKHKGEAPFYEELYRYRMDGLEINNINSVLTSTDMSDPLSFAVGKVALSQGVAAPRGDAKVAPISMYASGLSFSHKSAFGTLQRVEVKDLLLPDPEAMEGIIGLYDSLETAPAAAGKAADRKDAKAEPAADDMLDSALTNLLKYYDTHLFYTLFGVQGMNFTLKAEPESMTVALKGFFHTQSREGADVKKDGVDLSGLKFILPRGGDPVFAVLSHYAPEGITLNIKGDIRTGKDELASVARYELEGLGVLDGECVYGGDFAALNNLSLLTSEDAGLAVLQKLQLKKLSAAYKDSGLLAMVLELAAPEYSLTPEEAAKTIVQMGRELEAVPVKLYQEIGVLLKDQFTAPGEMGMSFKSEKPMSFMDLFTMAFMAPEMLPFSFTSTPGAKPLAEYLSVKEKAPAAPEKPAAPAAPEKPAAPAAPEKAEEPAAPAASAAPELPRQPETPAVPEAPAVKASPAPEKAEQ
ncbi:hypothetical protein [Mailhella massiliensis]|uniref:DUF945 family protein n=1 Tax=Mailhella massiliensis TaxID=1903261 RepID=A0A921DRM9_9BACT|nr:hypothetical protein [Mailhella massiliensis]HJD97143.1 hypothetical protein [Mailhella massiliensis]